MFGLSKKWCNDRCQDTHQLADQKASPINFMKYTVEGKGLIQYK